jgi:hypothetical protein
MHEPTTRPEQTRRASPREAAPTAAQWACCLAAGFAPGHPAAWQVAMYQVAHQQAVKSVRAAELRAQSARWN